MNTPELLYVSGSYIPAAGGAEQTMHTLMSQLQKRGFNCSVITRNEAKQPLNEDLDGIQVIRIPSKNLDSVLTSRLCTRRPDVVFTQLMWCERVIPICNRLEIPTIHFVRSTGGNLDLSNGGEYEVTEIVSDSDVTDQFIRGKWNRETLIVSELIDFNKYIVDERSASYISMVNPVQPKGGEIFAQIAKTLPNREFLAALGWDFLKNSSGNWDIGKMQEMADAHKDVLHIPQDIDISSALNIKVVGPYQDMREFYSQTRLLLMPSIWEEAFGRVVVEAMINRIPVIASGRGNLRKTVGEGGFIIDDPFDINAWKDAILLLDNPDTYHFFQEKAYSSAKRFDMETEIKKMVNLLAKIIRN